MKKFRLIAISLDPATYADRRPSRGDESVSWSTEVVAADNVAAALGKTSFSELRIVSVEEVPLVLGITDEQLETALFGDGEDVDPDSFDQPPRFEKEAYEGVQVYYGGDFGYIVKEVVASLRDAGLVPGIDCSREQSEGENLYMIEVRDEARGIYLSRSADDRDLIGDREIVGWSGVLSIARSIVDHAQQLL